MAPPPPAPPWKTSPSQGQSSSSNPSSNSPSKLSKFLPHSRPSSTPPSQLRDRSKSVGSETQGLKFKKKRPTDDLPPLPPTPAKQPSHHSPDFEEDVDADDEVPVIIEPPRSSPSRSGHLNRDTSSRGPSTSYHSLPSTSHSTSKLNDFPSRLSGWFSHFSSSSSNASDTPLSNVLSQHPHAAKLALGNVSGNKPRLGIASSSTVKKDREKAKSPPPQPLPTPPIPIAPPTPSPPPQTNELSTSTSSTSSFKLGGAAGAFSQAAKSSSRVVDRAFRYLRDPDHWEGTSGEDMSDAEDIWLLGTKYSFPVSSSMAASASAHTASAERDSLSLTSESDHQSSSSGNGSPRSKARKEKDRNKKKHEHHHSLSSASASSGASRLSMSNDPKRSSDTYQSANTSATSLHSHVQGGSGESSLDSSGTVIAVLGKPIPKGYPPGFYEDFLSTVWLTYRKEFALPIRDSRLRDLDKWEPLSTAPAGASSPGLISPSTSTSSSASNSKKRNYASGSDDPSTNYYSSSTSYQSSSSSTFSHSSGAGSSRSSGGGGAPTPSKNRWVNISLNSVGIAERFGRSGLLGEKGWTSDTGWGCMLRTGQSLLAETLVRIWVGKGYRPFDHVTERSVEKAKWIRLLSWFMDHPSAEAPFSVHRMALAGKDLGKDVGMWFGPSTAAGALRTLVNEFPQCKLGVSVASDGMLFQTEVHAASRSPGFKPEKEKHSRRSGRKSQAPVGWGDRAVLVLFGIRLGLEGVNPIYYNTIKQLYSFPQTVGIAGGRPSSSYYFVGVQGDHHLFYLDPHHARPAIPLRTVPEEVWKITQDSGGSSIDLTAATTALLKEEADQEKQRGRGSMSPPVMFPRNGDDEFDEVLEDVISLEGGKDVVIVRGSKPFGDPIDEDADDDDDDDCGDAEDDAENEGDTEDISRGSSYPGGKRRERRDTEKPRKQAAASGVASRRERRDTAKPSSSRAQAARPSQPSAHLHSHQPPPPTPQATPILDSNQLDPLVTHYLDSYPPEELATYHCDKVKRMPMSGLDPSMLIGFLVNDEEDWKDLRKRVSELPKIIFSIQDEPPTWSGDIDMSSDDADLDSVSELGEEGDEGVEEIESARWTPQSGDTEDDDPADPVTPGATNQAFNIGQKEEDFDDWVAPGMNTSLPEPAAVRPPIPPSSSSSSSKSRASSSTPSSGASMRERTSSAPKTKSSSSSRSKPSRPKHSSDSRKSSRERGISASGRRKEQPVPVPAVRPEQRLPFPVAEEEDDLPDTVDDDFVEMVRDDLDEDDDGQRTRTSSVIHVAGGSSSGGGSSGIQTSSSGIKANGSRPRVGGRPPSSGGHGFQS